MVIEHIAIWTPDLERLKEFYERYFEGQCSKKYVNPEKQFESYFLRFGEGARLELMCMPAVPQTADDPIMQATGLTHMAFSVGSREAVDRLTGRLAEDGYRIVSGPRVTGDGYYESLVLDPDGNRVEISE